MSDGIREDLGIGCGMMWCEKNSFILSFFDKQYIELISCFNKFVVI